MAWLIEDAKIAWRMWSVRLNAAGLALMTFAQFDFAGVLSAWNMMPPEVRSIIPSHWVSLLGAALFALSLIARIVRQPKLEAKRNGQ